MPITKTEKSNNVKNVIKATNRTLNNLAGFTAQTRSSTSIKDKIRFKNTGGSGDITFGADIIRKLGNPPRIQLLNDNNELIVGSELSNEIPQIELKPNGANFKIQSKALVLQILEEFDLDTTKDITYLCKIDFETVEGGQIIAVINTKEGVTYE